MRVSSIFPGQPSRRGPRPHSAAAFTLLEVMIAVAFLGIAMLALLAFHRQNLQAVIRAQELTRAAMLAQALMSQAETERFPPAGVTHGDFSRMFPGQNRNFHWQRTVVEQPLFPDLCRVQVRVFYGPGGRRSFDLVEFMHNPTPQPPPALAQALQQQEQGAMGGEPSN